MPLENVEFINPKDFKKPNNQSAGQLYSAEGKKDIFSDLALDVQMGLFPEQPYLSPFKRPKISTEPKESPGLISTTAHAFSENNELFSAGKAISTYIEHLNHLDDEVPDGWSPYDVNNLDGIDKKYWGFIFDSHSPAEMQSRKQWVYNKQEDNENYANGSTLGNFIGGTSGIIFSPTTALFPLSSTIKYAKASQNIIKNVARLSPEISAQAIAHNSFMQATEVGGNLEDLAVNSIRDATFGLTLVGGAIGYGSVVTGGKLFAARKIMNLNRAGIDVEHVINSEGEVIGRKAIPLEGNNLSSAEVSEAQDFLDSKMAKEGLFKVPGVSEIAGKFSPVVRMLNSNFTTVNEFANRLSSHSIVTEGLAKGRALKNNFETLLWDIRGRTQAIVWQLEGLRNEANGIINGGSPEFIRKALSENIDKSKYLSKEDFGDAVAGVIRTGELHSNKSINTAADLLNKHLQGTYKRFLKAHGLSEEILPPRTAINYLMRNYNRDAVMIPSKDWSGIISNHLKEQDDLIESLLEPIRAQENLIKEIEQTILNPQDLNGTSIKAHSDLLSNSKNELSRMENDLDIQLRDNPDYHILLESRNLLSSQDINQLKAILKPLKVADQRIDDFKNTLKGIREDRNKSKSASLKAKTDETKSKHLDEYNKLQKEVEKYEQQIKDMELERIKLDSEINGRALNGEINQRFFLKDNETGQIHFRNPNERPKLRNIYEDNNARIVAADAYRERILNYTPEQIGQQILGTLSGGHLENPLAERSLMIPDHVLQSAGFLSNDIGNNVSIYDGILGKKTAFRESFGGFGHEDGIKAVINRLANERKIKESEIKKLPLEEQDKSQRQLQKEFDKAKSDINKAYSHAMGHISNNYKMRQFSRGARAFTVSTRLGALPITMITDIAGVVLNNNIIRVIRDGLIPSFTTFNGFAQSKNGIAYRESASHLSIAIEHLNHAYTERFWNSSTMQDVSAAGKLVNGLEGIAHLSGNLSGANSMDNWIQRLAANVTQSKVMRLMFKHQEGTLSEKENLILNRFGIPANEWSQRFIDSYKKHGGETNGYGGHYSYYYNWNDMAASVKMGNAIRSGVRESVLKKGILDAPFWTNDPGWGLITHLKGWLFSSFTRYTVPTMQRPDSEKAIGMGVMLLMGSLVDPLRKWTRGESYDYSDKTKFALDTISNSGVMGIMADVLQSANALTHGEFLPKMLNDKYRERSIAGIFGGPLLGIGDDILNILTSIGSKKINQKDMNKMVRLIPGTQLWYLRYLSNKLVEAMNLPENRNHAEGWLN